jgi:hypothetical protein
MLMVLERVLVSLLLIMLVFYQLNFTMEKEMELQKRFLIMVITTGGKLKMTIEKDMDKIYLLMEEPTMVNIIIMNKMVMEFTRIINGVITDNVKMLNIMGTAI